MKTQQSVEETVMQILDNLQLDMLHPVDARKKVTKEIIELFDQNTANLKLINEKQGELIKHIELLSINMNGSELRAWGRVKNQLEFELQSLHEGKEKDEDEIDLSSPDYHLTCKWCGVDFWTKDSTDAVCGKCHKHIKSDD